MAPDGGSVSKYRAIADALESDWRELPPGEQLPAERFIAAEFGVSSMTARKALELLDRRGFVVRVPRRGTFIRGAKIPKTPALRSFSEEMRERGWETSTRLLGFERRPAPGEVAATLGVGADAPLLAVERLRFAQGEPICLELAYLPMQFEQQLTPADLESSLHEALTRLGHAPETGHRTASAVALHGREAMLLDLPDGSPALAMIHVFRDQNRLPIEYARSLYRPDRYEVTFEVRRDDAGRSATA